MFVVGYESLSCFWKMTYVMVSPLLNRNERIARVLFCEMMIPHSFDEFIQSLFRTEPALKLEQTAIVRSFVSLH